MDGVWTYRDEEGAKHMMTLTDAAAAADDTAVLRWLQSRRALAFTGITMQVAAANARLPILTWLRAQGCPHDMAQVCRQLLGSRRATPPAVAWCRSCGAGDWSPQGMRGMLTSALLNDTPALARCLRAEGAPWPEDLAELVATEIEDVRPQTILWAVQQGCPFGRWTTEVCELLEDNREGGRAVKRALHDLGCPCACPRPIY
eukprot:TRINITY_DN5338_c0_g1_i1.p3 TRINITY_DN5338_c0_g1~~TRINITY_DN5338_c0_g1_i1.p3  ORF type:complete len:202 (-),score=36.48 TRINITY_DN5338_c0_g1_i1:141-746(-)